MKGKTTMRTLAGAWRLGGGVKVKGQAAALAVVAALVRYGALEYRFYPLRPAVGTEVMRRLTAALRVFYRIHEDPAAKVPQFVARLFLEPLRFVQQLVFKLVFNSNQLHLLALQVNQRLLHGGEPFEGVADGLVYLDLFGERADSLDGLVGGLGAFERGLKFKHGEF